MNTRMDCSNIFIFCFVYWSDRLWKYKERLRQDLFADFCRMMYAGENRKAWASLFSKHLHDKIWSEGKHKKGVRFLTERLACTEVSRIRTSVQQQALQRTGVTHVMIITEADACADCKKKDGRSSKYRSALLDTMRRRFIRTVCSLGAVDLEGEWEEEVRIAEKKLVEEPEKKHRNRRFLLVKCREKEGKMEQNLCAEHPWK